MTKILLDGNFNFTDDQKARLDVLGQVDTLENIETDEQWLEGVKGYDVVCTWGDHVVPNLGKLENTLVTYPYTELGSYSTEALAENGVYVANAQGGNRKSIVEWTVYMVLSLYRKFPQFVRTTTQYPFTSTESIEGKHALIVGHGTIGTEVGNRLEAFGMIVSYFNRGDDLTAKAKDADIVINALSCNPSSENLLDEAFFANMKNGAFYVTFVRPHTYDIDGLMKAIDDGIVVGAGIDCDPEEPFDISNDFYQKCLTNEKILVTPHTAGMTKQAAANGREIMVQNVEAFVRGEPQNIVSKS